jgi:TatD DNase family protein
VDILDTHAHLDDEQLLADLPGVLARASAAGVQGIISIATTADSSLVCQRMAFENSGVFAAVGIQPNCCAQAAPGDWDRIVSLVDRAKVVALGETGLDGYWNYAPFDVQQQFFDQHLRLAQQRGLPVVVHMRDCGEPMLAMLQEARRRGTLTGVMHSFTGDAELMWACVELGMHISFAGMVTYKKSDALRNVAALVPDDRLLVETDAPYLSPEPRRGQRPNEPSLLIHTVECLAVVRGVTADQLARQTSENARRLFKLPKVADLYPS